MKRLVAILFGVFLAASGCQRESVQTSSEATNKTAPAETKIPTSNTEELARRISNLEPWSSEHVYSAAGWQRLVELATVFQKLDSATAKAAIGTFSSGARTNFHNDYLEISKAFLLNRVIFELPERAETKWRLAAGWITVDRDINPDGSRNLSWPLVWQNGNPILASKFIGYNGLNYDPSNEYSVLLATYPKRDLGAFERGVAEASGFPAKDEANTVVPHKR